METRHNKVHTHTHTHTHTHKQTHIHMHTHTHTLTDTHPHTHKHTYRHKLHPALPVLGQGSRHTVAPGYRANSDTGQSRGHSACPQILPGHSYKVGTCRPVWQGCHSNPTHTCAKNKCLQDLGSLVALSLLRQQNLGSLVALPLLHQPDLGSLVTLPLLHQPNNHQDAEFVGQ